jgi:hypothetical protein
VSDSKLFISSIPDLSLTVSIFLPDGLDSAIRRPNSLSQTSTASTLLRMASTNENLENYGKDDSSSIQNGIDVTEENMNQKNIL